MASPCARSTWLKLLRVSDVFAFARKMGLFWYAIVVVTLERTKLTIDIELWLR